MSCFDAQWLALRLASVATALVLLPGNAKAGWTSNGGTMYATECSNATNQVPLPPTWDTTNWKDNGPNPGNGDSYTGNEGGEIWYAIPTTGNPGLCVALVHANFTDVICQGKTGKACFWEGEGPRHFGDHGGNLPPATPPAANPNNPYILVSTTQEPDTNFAHWELNKSSILFGGQNLADLQDQIGIAMCTSCHQGANVFISHGGTHATNVAPKVADYNTWMPATWYDPIVSTQWLLNPPAGNYDKFPGSSLCVSCHGPSGTAGRLPDLSQTASPGFCSILRSVTSRNSTSGGMPFGTNCAVGANCSNTQTFPQQLLALCNDENLAASSRGASAWQSSTLGVADASRGNDGNTDGNWYHNSVFHTENTEAFSINDAFSGSWTQDVGLQNAAGTLAVNGLVFGLGRFSGSAGTAFEIDQTGYNWTSLGQSFKEISISGNIPNGDSIMTKPALWAVNPSGAVSTFSGGTFTHVGGVFTASHIAAGNGANPWAISSDGKTLFRLDPTTQTFQPMLMLPWEYFIAGSHPTWKLTIVAVGADDDAWVVDTGGNVYHQIGGPAPNQTGVTPPAPDTFHFPANIAWQVATPNFAGNYAIVNAMAVADRYNVWATSSSPNGIFNFVAPASSATVVAPATVNDLASKSWQHHCLSTGVCGGVVFKAISVGNLDGSVWAVSTTGGIYQVDENKNVFQKDANGNHDVNSTLSSLASFPGPSGTVGQVMSGGHPGWSDHQVIATSSTNGGTAYYTTGYYGKLPLPGGATWTVDLGAFSHVDQINLWNRTDCCAGRLSHFRILYFDGLAWVVGSDQSNTVFTNASPQEYSIPVSFDTQYVTVQKIPDGNSDDGYLHLAEVQVMGPPSPLADPQQF